MKEKNGDRGLRSTRLCRPSAPFAGPRAPHHSGFSFSNRLPSTAETLARICRDCQGTQDSAKKTSQLRSKVGGGGAELIQDLLAHRRCYQVSFLFRILYSAHIISLYNYIHTPCAHPLPYTTGVNKQGAILTNYWPATDSLAKKNAGRDLLNREGREGKGGKEKQYPGLSEAWSLLSQAPGCKFLFRALFINLSLLLWEGPATDSEPFEAPAL